MVTELLAAISEAIGLAKPLVDDAVAQKYETDFMERNKEIKQILADTSDSRPDRLASYFDRLCNDAGYPVAGGLGENISVPVAYVLQSAVIGNALIKDQAMLAKFTQKLTE